MKIVRDVFIGGYDFGGIIKCPTLSGANSGIVRHEVRLGVKLGENKSG